MMYLWGKLSECEIKRINFLAREAERLSEHRCISDFLVAQKISENIAAKFGHESFALPVPDGEWEFYKMISTIWTAGCLEGIRRERKKHKGSKE